MVATNKKIVFFGCSMRGGYGAVSREELAEIPGLIEECSCAIISKHQTEKNIIQKEDLLSKKEIHNRDYKWLKDSDFGVFEISNSSLGVGAEISDMIHLGKPVLCLFKKGLEQSVSAYILGKEKSDFVSSVFECCEYNTKEDILKNVSLFIKNIHK